MGIWWFGNGRIGRKRGKPRESSLVFSSSSGSEESEFELDRVDDESLVTWPRLPEEEDELEIE